MKKISILLIVLILCASVLLCSCAGNTNNNTTTTTTPPQEGQSPLGGVFGDLTWEDILSGNFENLELSLPACEISISGLGDEVGDLLMLENIKIKDNAIYFPCVSMDGYDSGYELTGRYLVFDGGKVYAVDCMNEEEYTVNVSDFSELSSEVDTSELEAMMEELEAMMEEITALFEGFPELTDEYKDYSADGKYRIDKEYFKEVIEFIYEKIGELSDETMEEIPEEVWAIIDEMTIEIDVTETDGEVSSIEGVIAYEYEEVIDFSFEFAVSAEGGSLEMSLNVPSEEVSCDVQLLVNAETFDFSVNMDTPENVIDMSVKMIMTDSKIDMTFDVAVSSEYSDIYAAGTGVNKYDVYESYGKDDISFLMEFTFDMSKINTAGEKFIDFTFDMSQSSEYTSKINGVVDYDNAYETEANISAYAQLDSDGGYDFGISASSDGIDMFEILGTLTFTDVTIPDVSDLIANAE